MTKEEIKNRRREEEDYYLKKEVELPFSDNEAQRRYEQFLSKDPYPMIEAALLNSADIFQYVAKTGMIYPFHSDMLQGASYEVAIRGTVIWWDEEKKEEHIEQLTKPEDSFKLEPNSIAFVTLEPMFRIPDYLALRFNLKIIHVYKGLLLGTGPIVDPGFVGRLSIPLHNLTANTYTFHAGDGIIQMEFTKLSRNDIWLTKKNSMSGLYKRKWIKPGRTLQQYIVRALEGSSEKVVKSAIPNELTKVKEQSNNIQNEIEIFKEGAENKFNNFKIDIENFRKGTEDNFKDLKSDIEKRLNRTQWISAATVISIAALVITIMGYACTTIYQLGSANSIKQQQIYDLEKKYEQLLQGYIDMQEELSDKVDELENRINCLESEKGKE